MRRLAFVAGSVVAMLAVWPAAAQADPRLTISSARQEAGFVEFYLSGSELPSGGRLDASTLTASVDGKTLPLTAGKISQSQGRSLKRTTALVIDTSGSMKDAMSGAKAAALSFIEALPTDIQLTIVTAGAPSLVALRPTADRIKARDAVNALRDNGETALYDAIVSAAGLIKSGTDERRIVVLSDGADTASTATYDAARRAVGDVPIDTIAFKTNEAASKVLADLSAATHGRSYQAGDTTALRSVFAQAAGAFSAQLLVRITVPPELQGKEAKLVLQATVGDAVVSTDLTVTFIPDTRVKTPLTGTISSGVPMWLQLGLLGVVFVGLLAVGALAVGPLVNSGARRRRLAQVEQFAATPRAAPQRIEADSPIAQAALQMSQQVMKQTNVEGRLARQLDRAGMRLRPHEWLLLRTAVFIVCVLLGALLLPKWYLGAMLGAVVGLAGTSLYHRLRASHRLNAFADQLPDALQLVIGSLRSGFSLTQSVDAMTRELGDPIQTEFGRALGETRLGVDIEDALDRVAVRMKNKDLAFVVVAIRVQREIGGNLAEVLTTTVNTMRERATLQRQVRALSAEGRLSAYILIALPFGVLTYMLITKGNYLLPLVQSTTGLAMAAFGVVEVIIGTIWMLKVVKVEV